MSRLGAAAGALILCAAQAACQRQAANPPPQACHSPPLPSASATASVATASDTATKSEPRDQLHTYFDLEFRRDDSKFAVEGPFYIGDPVHETITLLAAHDAGYAKAESTADVPELIRGVFWNDDPCAQLFDDQREGLKKSTGLEWYLDFRAAGKSAKEGKPLPKLVCPWKPLWRPAISARHGQWRRHSRHRHLPEGLELAALHLHRRQRRGRRDE